LPLVSPPTEEKPPGSARAPVEETVLVVEEEALMRAFIRATLGRAGYRVLEAESAEDALGLARRHPGPIHLVITNVQSPRIDGRELAGALSAERPSLATIYASSSTLSPLHVPPGAQWLRKPIAPDSLLATVKAALAR